MPLVSRSDERVDERGAAIEGQRLADGAAETPAEAAVETKGATAVTGRGQAGMCPSIATAVIYTEATVTAGCAATC